MGNNNHHTNQNKNNQNKLEAETQSVSSLLNNVISDNDSEGESEADKASGASDDKAPEIKPLSETKKDDCDNQKNEVNLKHLPKKYWKNL